MGGPLGTQPVGEHGGDAQPAALAAAAPAAHAHRTTPALQAHDRSNLARFEALLAEAVAADLDMPGDSLRPHLVSAAVVAAVDAGGGSPPSPRPGAANHALAVMDEALVFVRGGLEALRRHAAI